MDAAAVRDDLTWAEFEADHGSPAKAVAHARAEYARHPNLTAADALAWALHRAGRDREAGAGQPCRYPIAPERNAGSLPGRR
ncbi:hypothetical protein, partial [Nonomuraea sp. NPDC003754]